MRLGEILAIENISKTLKSNVIPHHDAESAASWHDVKQEL